MRQCSAHDCNTSSQRLTSGSLGRNLKRLKLDQISKPTKGQMAFIFSLYNLPPAHSPLIPGVSLASSVLFSLSLPKNTHRPGLQGPLLGAGTVLGYMTVFPNLSLFSQPLAFIPEAGPTQPYHAFFDIFPPLVLSANSGPNHLFYSKFSPHAQCFITSLNDWCILGYCCTS